MLAIAASNGAAPIPFYEDKTNLLVYLDEDDHAQPVLSTADWGIRRAQIQAHFEEVAGKIPARPAQAPAMTEEESVAFPRYVRKKIRLTVASNDVLPAYLLIPKHIEDKAPAVLCLHPTSKFGKGMVVGLGDRPNRNYATELAQRGYVTLAPDYPGFGDYSIDVYARGWASATAKGIWNHMRCVDFLQSLPEVDGDRIGCIGHSLGGHNALFVALFDDRIKAVVTSCGFTKFSKYYGGDLTGWSHQGYMPRIAEVYGKDPARMPFDFTEILAAMAPRPVYINAPLHDTNFDVFGVRLCVAAATPVYQLFGASGNVVVAHPDCGHDFPPAQREAAYRLLDRALRRRS